MRLRITDMKKIMPVFIPALLFAGTIMAQMQYQVLVERPNEKSLKGIISKEVLLSDSTFTWFAANQKIYTPQASAVEALRANKDSVELLVFMGTWCEDSHFVIPRFFALLDAAGFPGDRVTLIGTDRNKKTLSHLCEAMNVTNVPTIIVMRKGREMGRVVEYGSSGMFDKDLGTILSASR